MKVRSMIRDLPLRAAVALTTMAPVLAMAQATDPFDTAVTNITAKVQSYGAALVTLAAVSVVFFLGIKYVKKLPKAG
jgi:hypothetical protein